MEIEGKKSELGKKEGNAKERKGKKQYRSYRRKKRKMRKNKIKKTKKQKEIESDGGRKDERRRRIREN